MHILKINKTTYKLILTNDYYWQLLSAAAAAVNFNFVLQANQFSIKAQRCYDNINILLKSKTIKAVSTPDIVRASLSVIALLPAIFSDHHRLHQKWLRS